MEIKDIKFQLSIDQVLSYYQLRADSNNRLSCPFHEDRTPSMQVYPKTGTWTCFSSNCKMESGDVIDFIMHKESITKHKAILKSKELIGLDLMGRLPEPSKAVKRPRKGTVKYPELFAHFSHSFKKESSAIAYAQKRNLNADNLELGYNPGTNHQALKNCLVFPLKDASGKMVDFYGRSIASVEGQSHFYQSNRKGLYPHYPSVESKSIILTESIIDAASLLQYGYENVLALFGTNGFSDEHAKALKRLAGLEELILFFDGDGAGQKAAKKYETELGLLFSGVRIRNIDTPVGEDINSLLDGHGSAIFEHLLASPFSFSIEADPEHFDASNERYITYLQNGLRYSLLGGVNLEQIDRLQVTLKISIEPQRNSLQSIRQTLDLYNYRGVESYIRASAEQLEVGTTNLRKGIAGLIDQIEQYRFGQLESQSEKRPEKKPLTAARQTAIKAFLKSAKLMTKTNELIGQTGVIGQAINRQIMWLCYTSRKRATPLHVITLGSSGSGKTYLQENILRLMPEEEIFEATNLSDNALYYFESNDLSHKVVAIEDMTGAGEAVMYALRELMSKQKISKTIALKDSRNNMRAVHFTVEGPICLTTTTTMEHVYEDNANRSILLYSNDSSVHQKEIMTYQARKSAGLIDRKQQQESIEFLQDVQRVLQPIRVINPYALELQIPEQCFKKLRTNQHYHLFIETITFYHQFQRPLKKDDHGVAYIETSIEDIEIANALIKDVLLSKSDELTNACRSFYQRLEKWLITKSLDSFYAHQVREQLRINPNTLKRYLRQLKEYGYLKVVGGNRYKSGLEYSLAKKEAYKELKANVVTVLDEALSQIKAKK